MDCFSQVQGCKDPAANNYNSSATVNDGSCLYPSTSYTPTIQVNPLSDTLVETSGLQWAGNSLWSFNDGGHDPVLYRISTGNKNILQIITLEGATNVDWEDIAFDGAHFYIGDFGNNANGARTDLKIYKFPISAIPTDYIANRQVTISSGQIEVINFSYSDQLTITPTTANNTAYDCEAMIARNGALHLFTKNWISQSTTHYLINGTTGGTYLASPVDTLPTDYLVTGADISPNGKVIVLLGYQTSGFGNHFMHVLSDFTGNFFFKGNKRKISLPNALVMGQAEGICFIDNVSGYISNEGVSSPITVTQKLRTFNTSSFVPFSLLPIKPEAFQVLSRNGLHEVGWAFPAPVKELKVIRLSQNISEEIYRSHISKRGLFITSPSGEKDCYQLLWQEEDGKETYSNTICLQAKNQHKIERLVMQGNGQLSFLFHGRQEQFQLRVFSTEGRLLSQTKKMVTQGLNTLQLPASLSTPMAIIQMTSNQTAETYLLRVQ